MPKYVGVPTEADSQEICPETSANLLSRIVFWWAQPLLARGYKKPLEEEDIYSIPSTLNATNVPPLNINWSVKRPLTRAVLSYYFKNFWWIPLIEFATTIPLCLGPFLVQVLVFAVQSGSTSISNHLIFTNVWQAVVGLFLCRLTLSTLQQNFFWCGLKAGLTFNALILSMIYKKALRTSLSCKSTGKISNIIAIDAEAILLLAWVNLVFVISTPMQIIVLVSLACYVIGPSGLIGFSILAIAGAVQLPLAKRMNVFYTESRVKSDERVKVLTEMLQGIRVIKYYNWEPAFKQRVQQIRDEQMKQTLNARQYELWGLAISLIVIGVACASTFSVFVALGNTLTAEIAFTTLALFQAINLPIRRIPGILSEVANYFVSAHKVQKAVIDQNMTGEIKIDDADFFWDPIVPQGKLVCVVGPVGSGKSALVQALLGELFLSKGSISVPNSISYTPQSPWLLSASVKDNILFGKPMDKKRYDDVIAACALKKDLALFPAGDLSEIGEKGVNLSGGQQHRISLARALYANSSCFIMDEPLSAVDPHVAKWLFDKCIQGMMANSTRVLVTHQLQFLSSADLIVVIDHGKITHTGTYFELVAKGLDFETILRKKFDENSSDEKNISDGATVQEGEEEKEEWTDEDLSQPSIAKSEDKARITTDEERHVGAVAWDIYKQYLAAAGSVYYWIGMLLMYTVTQITTLSGSFWITQWTSNSISASSSVYISVYFGILALAGLCQRLCGKFVLTLTYRSSENLHQKLLSSVVGARATFFDTTPSGRVMNRFSKDQGKLDTHFMLILHDVMECGLTVACTLLAICILTPLFIVPCFLLTIPFYLIQRYYRQSARELKRLRSISYSSVMSSAAEASTGLPIIRAFKLENFFTNNFHIFVDKNAELIYNEYAANRWLNLRLEWIANLLVFLAATVSIIAMKALGPGMVGLVITSTMSFAGSLAWCVRQVADLETSMNAVERITHYGNTIPQEPKDNLVSVPEDWPTKGSVDIRDLVVKYRPDLDPVLRGISCNIKPGEKIGVVGRTGAGKTTLTSSIFRMVEAASGSIEIDGINIANIDLQILRSRLSIIPQDPVLFSGSIRSNMDPYNLHSDTEIWSVLEQVHLKEQVKLLPEQLDYCFKEGGSDFSLGQKQLVCLGRALLRNSKILIMDEATASLDFKTDALIKATVRECFASKTLITIAHRLDTILDSDRVMVFEQGNIVEFDSPASLLSNPSSMFSLSVNAARKSMYQKS